MAKLARPLFAVRRAPRASTAGARTSPAEKRCVARVAPVRNDPFRSADFAGAAALGSNLLWIAVREPVKFTRISGLSSTTDAGGCRRRRRHGRRPLGAVVGVALLAHMSAGNSFTSQASSSAASSSSFVAP